MEDRYMKFIESATKQELEQLIHELEVEKNRELEEIILFLSSLL